MERPLERGAIATSAVLLAILAILALSRTPAAAAENPEGVKRGDPNPGRVPERILSEPDSLEVAGLGGHKVFSGPNRGGSADIYLNIDFHCDGTGTYEGYVPAQFPIKNKIRKGALRWDVRSDGARVTVEPGDREPGFTGLNHLTIDIIPRAGRSLVVGRSRINDIDVARIVQHERCADSGSAPPVSDASPAAEDDGTVQFHENPGDIPTPILAEHTGVAFTELGGVKVFAGPDEEGPTYYDYFNMAFDCDGTGTFEAFPQADLPFAVAFTELTKGTMSWQLFDQDRKIRILIEGYSEGEFAFTDELDLDSATYEGPVEVGQSVLEDLYVSRLVRYRQCDR